MTRTTLYLDGIRSVRPASSIASEMKSDLGKILSFLSPTYLLRHADNSWLSNPGGPPPRPIIFRPLERDIQSAQVVLILGSNDLAPPRHAALLFRQIVPHNPDIKLVASGNGGHLTVPGSAFSVPEAEKYKEELLATGVPGKNILIEATSTNTGKNLTMSEKLLNEMGLQPRRIIVVQTPALQLRANLAFERQWQGEWDYYISSPPKPSAIDKMSLPKADFYLASVLRELLTLIKYSYDPEGRFQTKRAIPQELIGIAIKYYNIFCPRSPVVPERFFEHIVRMEDLFRMNFRATEKGWEG